MNAPCFVQTSEGYINLALLTWIRKSGDGETMSFHLAVYEGDNANWIAIPIEEGEKILGMLRENAPDLFVIP